MTWDQSFTELFDRCLTKYRSGDKDFETYYTAADLAFLRSIGHKPRELFDFVEDWADEGEPAPSTALLIAAVRRDYFLTIQEGKASEREIGRDDIPTFGEEFEGLPYFPRILAKARAKLRGELDPDLMFGCGGDRNFLGKNGRIHPADFLRHTWAAGEDASALARWVKEQAG